MKKFFLKIAFLYITFQTLFFIINCARERISNLWYNLRIEFFLEIVIISVFKKLSSQVMTTGSQKYFLQINTITPTFGNAVSVIQLLDSIKGNMIYYHENKRSRKTKWNFYFFFTENKKKISLRFLTGCHW